MPEGPNPGPARRGRKDPNLALELEANEPEAFIEDADFLTEAGDIGEQDEILVLPGDVIAAKVVHQVSILGKDSWITFGLQTRVMDGEDEADVFERVGSVVNTRVLDLAEDAYQRIAAAQAERDEQLQQQPSGRIQPRRNR